MAAHGCHEYSTVKDMSESKLNIKIVCYINFSPPQPSSLPQALLCNPRQEMVTCGARVGALMTLNLVNLQLSPQAASSLSATFHHHLPYLPSHPYTHQLPPPSRELQPGRAFTRTGAGVTRSFVRLSSAGMEGHLQ